ncbi:MAG: hypothetical protein WCG02_02405 [Candidatus Taylorbacteria bacterium]
MYGRKILVCTAFREFNGDVNDKIQRMFLSGLRNQTYQNYVLVPTIFGQKNVELALIEEEIPYKAFFGDAGKYRYSLSQAVENAITMIDKPESYILIWTCCDDLLENTFFEKVMSALTPLSSCTSMPHISYRSITDYENKAMSGYMYGGIDLICFDGDVFLNDDVKTALRDYPNMGWGMTEYFFSAIGRAFCKNMYNIWPAKIERFDNDRKASKETHSYFALCIENNRKMYTAFTKKYNLTGDVYRSVLSYKTPLKHMKVKFMIYLKININRLQSLLFKDWMFKMIPTGVKRSLKKIIGRNINDMA